jgi:hypothetical protein
MKVEDLQRVVEIFDRKKDACPGYKLLLFEKGLCYDFVE